METIAKLTPESNLRVIVDTLNKFIEMGNINTKTLMTLTKSSGEPVKVFEATQKALITGEVYTLEMSGMYQVVTSGQGRTKIIIKDHKTDSVIDTIILNNAGQSKLYFLSEGDKVYIHSSPAGTSTMTTNLMVVQTMYDLMEESNIASIKQEVDIKLNEFESQIEELNEAHNKKTQDFTTTNLNVSDVTDGVLETSTQVVELAGNNCNITNINLNDLPLNPGCILYLSAQGSNIVLQKATTENSGNIKLPTDTLDISGKFIQLVYLDSKRWRIPNLF